MALTDQAIVKIKDMILAGELKPGDRLPPEKELSEALGLSRSSLREAVKALEIIHVLDVRRGDGTYVTSLKPEVLLGAMSFMADIHQDASVLELFAVRRILEPAAAAMACGRITPAHDLIFHRSVCELAGNAYLTSLLDTLSGSTLRARVWRGLTEEGSVERTLTEHREIVDALESGDAELVSSRVTVHVSGVAAWLQRALG